jgi:hypothetical protein
VIIAFFRLCFELWQKIAHCAALSRHFIMRARHFSKYDIDAMTQIVKHVIQDAVMPIDQIDATGINCTTVSPSSLKRHPKK